ncbi:DUF4257 domain-containing protein [Bacillus carboniphilus]|uniref:DUF4257 domain-containing protein n=1 Tax=Bacillus carboniphilus TaxID=86663 RepID=A0ABY9JP29_9BACI|nr:DUF4257 domain-containing protein [Bacillus carboniphilus]WLR41166.1 DUF4257 domain-containing protein [Bacillus carboniphilus]
MLEQFVLTSLVAGIIGVLGHVSVHGKVEKPRMTKKYIYLGVLEDLLSSIIAAFLLVLTTEPDSSLKVVILAIVAGYGGESVLRGFDFIRQYHHTKGKDEKDQ